jgi:hypothetical protein
MVGRTQKENGFTHNCPILSNDMLDPATETPDAVFSIDPGNSES